MRASRASRASRVLRAALAASIATFAALLSHVVAGGELPGALGVAVPWVLSLAVCTALAGRRLSLLRLSLAVPLSQLLFHALFAVGAGGPPAAGPHAHHAPFAFDAAALAPAEPAMWLGHALATALTVALVHRGERTLVALRALAAQLGTWLRRRLRMPAAPARLPAPARVRVVAVILSLRPRVGTATVSRRGPPSPVVA